MIIKDYNLYLNKTWELLVPCLISHGEAFMSRFNNMLKLAVGVHDTLLDGAPDIKGNNIYILIQKDSFPSVVSEFAHWIQYQPYYVVDYCPDSKFLTSNKHMFVLSVPKEHDNAYMHFLKGEYSKMYTKNFIEKLFSKEKKAYKILTRDESLLPDFVEEVNNLFTVRNPLVLTKEDLQDRELALPLIKEEEIFNYTTNQGVFFNEEVYKEWLK